VSLEKDKYLGLDARRRRQSFSWLYLDFGKVLALPLPMFIVSHNSPPSVVICHASSFAAKGCHKDLDGMHLGAFEIFVAENPFSRFSRDVRIELSNRG
jgi:hypothetical protein